MWRYGVNQRDQLVSINCMYLILRDLSTLGRDATREPPFILHNAFSRILVRLTYKCSEWLDLSVGALPNEVPMNPSLPRYIHVPIQVRITSSGVPWVFSYRKDPP